MEKVKSEEKSSLFERLLANKPKTIEDLNKYMLYRLIKVCYGFLLLCFLLGGIGGAYSDSISSGRHRYFDPSKTIVTCENGRILTMNLSITDKTYFSYQDEDLFKKACTLSPEIEDWRLGVLRGTFPTYINTNYTITKAYQSPSLEDYTKLLGYLLLVFLGIPLIHKIIKRTFYYIFLGQIFPKN